jgi:hypothetical protein
MRQACLHHSRQDQVEVCGAGEVPHGRVLDVRGLVGGHHVVITAPLSAYFLHGGPHKVSSK